MQRATVFLLYGPASVAFITWLALQETLAPFAAFVAMFAFFLTLPITAVVGAVDEGLALCMPIFPRAPLTAAAGAIVMGGGLSLFLSDHMPPPSLRFWIVVGAAYGAICSLLANDWVTARQVEEIDASSLGP